MMRKSRPETRMLNSDLRTPQERTPLLSPALGDTSSQTAPSPPPCWTGSSTKVSCSPFRETATGSAPTMPKPENSDRKETTTRLTERPQGAGGITP